MLKDMRVTPNTVLPKNLKKIEPLPRSSQSLNSANNPYIASSLKREGAIAAVDRIFKHGKNESGEPLVDTLWFRDQLRLTADDRLRQVLTTGASQVSKSLGNYLVCIDTIVHGQINIGWFYASRQSMQNQQPEQFQKMIGYWLQSVDNDYSVSRESISRYSVGQSTANFSYANSSTESKGGGAAEGKEQASFQASKLFLEERSNWKSAVDVTPRLGASKLPSKPVRELGTPGAGAGIERLVNESAHLFSPAVFCGECDRLTFLEPKGALLKSKIDDRSGRPRWFNARGEILDYWSKDGTPMTAYVACTHCGGEITASAIAQCRLHSKQTGVSASDFLDQLPDESIFDAPISIYLSPLLRLPNVKYPDVEITKLVREGLSPDNPSIYQQNKLGYQSETDSNGVTIEDIERVSALPPWDFSECVGGEVVTIAGFDQGRDQHWGVVIQYHSSDPEKKNILLADAIAQSEVLSTLDYFSVNYALIDNEPDRLSSYSLVENSDDRLALADQRDIDSSYKEIKVRHGGEEIPAYAINQVLFKDILVSGFTEENYRTVGKLHRKFRKHLTSVRRDPDTGRWLRPIDHDDDLFFAFMFAEAAIAVYKDDSGADWIGGV